MPIASSNDFILAGIHDTLHHVLQHPSANSPLSPLPDSHHDALIQITTILTSLAAPPQPTPVLPLVARPPATADPPLRVDPVPNPDLIPDPSLRVAILLPTSSPAAPPAVPPSKGVISNFVVPHLHQQLISNWTHNAQKRSPICGWGTGASESSPRDSPGRVPLTRWSQRENEVR